MYVYYETYKYPGAFYTHRITVYENANGRLRAVLEAKYGRKAVSWNRSSERIYVRETMRIARVHQNKTRTNRTKHFGEWDFATSRNFALSIYAHIDVGLGLHSVRCGKAFEELA